MTLLTICQNVAKEVPLNVPTSIIGNSSETAKILLQCANKAGKSIARRKGRHHWLSLITEYTFSTADGTADYNLPSDFQELENATLWNRSDYERLKGPLSPRDWQTYKSGVLASSATINQRFRIRNVSGTVKFSVDPTPSVVETLAFEYVSTNWCEDSSATGQSAWVADDDVGVISEYLIELETLWRTLRRLGMSYLEERNEAEREIAKALANDGGAPILKTNQTRTLRLIDHNNIPETGFGS